MPQEKSDIIKMTDDEIRKAIGLHIKTIRRGKINLSAEVVAKKLGVSRATLTQIENGKTNITAVTLWKIACVLETKIEDFFPKTPDGFGLNKQDLQQIASEDEKVVTWAKQLFGTSEK